MKPLKGEVQLASLYHYFEVRHCYRKNGISQESILGEALSRASFHILSLS
ncbi:hypothetical protein ACRRTK_003992 [Alexandromys fortis]